MLRTNACTTNEPIIRLLGLRVFKRAILKKNGLENLGTKNYILMWHLIMFG